MQRMLLQMQAKLEGSQQGPPGGGIPDTQIWSQQATGAYFLETNFQLLTKSVMLFQYCVFVILIGLKLFIMINKTKFFLMILAWYHIISNRSIESTQQKGIWCKISICISMNANMTLHTVTLYARLASKPSALLLLAASFPVIAFDFAASHVVAKITASLAQIIISQVFAKRFRSVTKIRPEMNEAPYRITFISFNG